ncbi:hypothetical protein [Brevundimonas sp.]|uniref:DUF6950 family protein n=1 Tax=Brevundimonas sp. TaxID=1871086 RepID=UPI0035B0F90F
MILVKRKAATQAVINRFNGALFEWGKADCVQLTRACLVGLGHSDPLPRKRYGAPRTAKKLFRDSGFTNLVEAMDSLGLEKIGAAETLPGDIVAFEGAAMPEAFGDYGLGVVLGQGRFLAFVRLPQGEAICGAGLMAEAPLNHAWRSI